MINFNAQVFVDCAEELLRADETERALWLLDNLPAFYRDHVPKKVIDLKNDILSRIATPQFYKKGNMEAEVMDTEDGHGMIDSLRGAMVLKDVNWFSAQKQVPHIIDYGPGDYWLPIALNKAGATFTYEAIYMNERAHEKAKPILEKINEKNVPLYRADQPRIFVACEIIEHLWNEADIKTEMLSHGGPADIIHISTPRYTFDTDCKNWKDKVDLGHLRAYTPREFTNTLDRIFKDYNTHYFDHQIMHCRLTSLFTKIPGLKERSHLDYDKL